MCNKSTLNDASKCLLENSLYLFKCAKQLIQTENPCSERLFLQDEKPIKFYI